MSDGPFRSLLSEGLDLCVRARKLDDADKAVREFQRETPDATRCATVPLWVADQYERDLADWERRAREALAK